MNYLKINANYFKSIKPVFPNNKTHLDFNNLCLNMSLTDMNIEKL